MRKHDFMQKIIPALREEGWSEKKLETFKELDTEMPIAGQITLTLDDRERFVTAYEETFGVGYQRFAHGPLTFETITGLARRVASLQPAE